MKKQDVSMLVKDLKSREELISSIKNILIFAIVILLIVWANQDLLKVFKEIILLFYNN